MRSPGKSDGMTKPLPWWKGLFFRLSLDHIDPEPLLVPWPAGKTVITMNLFVAITAWTVNDRVIGVSNPTTVTLEADFSEAIRCFHWALAPQAAWISSVKIDGKEQLLQPTTLEDLRKPERFGIVGALFQRQPYIHTERRAWWAWIPRLWEREDEYDD